MRVVRRPFHVPSADWSVRDAAAALVSNEDAGAVERLEAVAEDVLGHPVVAFGSARSALAATFCVIAREPRVFVPAFTCVAVPNAVVTAGGTIEWVDVAGANLDLDAILAKATSGDVVVAQHTYGIPLDAGRLREMRARGIYVVEDRAHRFDGEELAGQVAVYSLEHSKVVSAGHGGLVASDDPDLLEELRRLRATLAASSRGAARTILRTSAVQRLLATRAVPAAFGSIARRAALRVPFLSAASQSIDELAGGGVQLEALAPDLAAAGLRSLRHLAANRAHRRRAAERYLETLPEFVPEWARPVGPFVRMPIEVDDADAVVRRLRTAGVDLGRRWFDAPVHPSGSRSSYVPGSAPRAERLASRVLSLPTHPLMTAADIETVAQAVRAAA
jgi:dTDP-4-amino-4,6-dideoxygalactose transaminase